ncbi:MAG: succinate dehydrogenase, cytochrome b556 subunit [Pseudomonadota bacterium]
MADTPERPLSPHMQIYRPQISSVLSISHRMTGLVLSLGALFFVIWLVLAASGEAYFEFAQAIAGSWLGYAFLILFSLCLFYHLLNGIRHLFWDMGHGFDLTTMARTGWAVVIGCVVLTTIAWIFGLTAMGVL